MATIAMTLQASRKVLALERIWLVRTSWHHEVKSTEGLKNLNP
jgi:hypothetical protein